MAVTLTGTGGLFTRLGKLIQILVRVEAHQTDGTSGLAAEIEDVIDEYNSTDMGYADQLIDSTEDWQKSAANIFNALSRMAKDTIIGMVNDDTTLNQLTLKNALDELIEQMGTASDVKGNVYSISGTGDGGIVFTGSGDGYIITSKSNGKEQALQNLHVDKTVVVCTKDAQVSGTPGRETFRMRGEKKITDIRDVLFPGGNGQNNTISVSDPAYSQQSNLNRNSLANGTFETFSVPDTPNNWPIDTGVPGTGIQEEGTVVHRGSKSLKFVGDAGGTLLHIHQTFDTPGQTTVKLKPQTKYCVSFWSRRDAAVAGGVLRVSMKDGGGTDISPSAALVVTLTSDTANTWVHHSFAFATPLDLPDSAAFHIELTTAITNTSSVFIDSVQIFRMGTLTGSVSTFHIAVIPGETDFIVDDTVDITIAKTTIGKFQTHLNRLLGMEDMGIQFPFQIDASESISDSLIS